MVFHYLTFSIWQIGAETPPSEDFTIAQLLPMSMLRESSVALMESETDSCAYCVTRAEREEKLVLYQNNEIMPQYGGICSYPIFYDRLGLYLHGFAAYNALNSTSGTRSESYEV